MVEPKWKQFIKKPADGSNKEASDVRSATRPKPVQANKSLQSTGNKPKEAGHKQEKRPQVAQGEQQSSQDGKRKRGKNATKNRKMKRRKKAERVAQPNSTRSTNKSKDSIEGKGKSVKAKEYLSSFAHDRPNWSFSKPLETYIVKNVMNVQVFTADCDEILAKYATGIKGGARDRLETAIDTGLNGQPGQEQDLKQRRSHKLRKCLESDGTKGSDSQSDSESDSEPSSDDSSSESSDPDGQSISSSDEEHSSNASDDDSSDS